MKLNWSHWFYTLTKTVIGGVAAAGSAWLGTLVGSQMTAEIKPLDWKQFGIVIMASAALNLFFFLAKSPLPEDEEAPPAVPPSASRLPLWLVCGFLSLGLLGCVHLQPGADPLVVRTEQFLTSAQGTFQYVLKVDQVDRPFWQTQAPAFHAFCEELRRPTPYQVTNTLPQYRVALLSLADVKRDYQTAKASSNDLFTALTTLQSVNQQAGAWLTIVTNRPK
jgi:hypothetical protein